MCERRQVAHTEWRWRRRRARGARKGRSGRQLRANQRMVDHFNLLREDQPAPH